MEIIIIATAFGVLLAGITLMYIMNVNKRCTKCRYEDESKNINFTKEGYDYLTQSGIPLFKGVTYEVRGDEYEFVGEITSLNDLPNKKCMFIVGGVIYIRKEIADKAVDTIKANDIA